MQHYNNWKYGSIFTEMRENQYVEPRSRTARQQTLTSRDRIRFATDRSDSVAMDTSKPRVAEDIWGGRAEHEGVI